jgi:hypothetical protein
MVILSDNYFHKVASVSFIHEAMISLGVETEKIARYIQKK